MWSVALTDLFQTVMILVGLVLVAWLVGDMAGGPAKVIAAAAEAGKFEFCPKGGDQGVARLRRRLADARHRLDPAAGRVPARHLGEGREHRGPRHPASAAVVYFCFAFVPIFIAYAGAGDRPGLRQALRRPRTRARSSASCPTDSRRTPMWAQVLFFGALLSAILSTASGALHRADLAVHRERDPAVRAAHERPAVPAPAARRARAVHARRRCSSRSIRRAPCTKWCRTPTR